MGGRLGAESVVGTGSTFTVEIPLPWREGRDEEQAILVENATPAADQPVLLVEDNPVNQTVIEAMLRSLGHETQLAVDGAQALQAARDKAYGAILMDCRLPGLDGYAVSRQIRAEPGPNRDTPIIALTANALAGDRETCLAAGMNDYLAKPFKRSDLRLALQRWMRARP